MPTPAQMAAIAVRMLSIGFRLMRLYNNLQPVDDAEAAGFDFDGWTQEINEDIHALTGLNI